jgi:hypothetical protein
MLIVADKQILCGSCGALVGLFAFHSMNVTLLKDGYVVFVSVKEAYCNSTCKERAQV